MDECFTEFPYIYSVACLLDPGVRMKGLENMFKHYYEVLGVQYDYTLYIRNCLNLLHRLIDIYTPKTPNVVQPKPSGTSRFNSTISGILTKKTKC